MCAWSSTLRGAGALKALAGSIGMQGRRANPPPRRLVGTLDRRRRGAHASQRSSSDFSRRRARRLASHRMGYSMPDREVLPVARE